MQRHHFYLPAAAAAATIVVIFTVLAGCIRAETSATYVITTAAELIKFSDSVNNGTNFKGTTVLLGNDIDFSNASESYVPAGHLEDRPFNGTFDGQGHVIRNLRLTTNRREAGLFGYSSGSAVRNVVMDSSCAVSVNYTGKDYYAYVGGIIGHCISNSSKCVLEGCVNMAAVTLLGSLIERTAMVGGITGECSPYDLGCSITNCVNYGSITFNGIARYNTYVAGQ